MDYTYYEDEVRSGFYVPGMMKKAWAAQLEDLKEIDRICKKYDIQYFAEWGTLLGAIRHKGMIPWDDDLDIAMKRADYNKFCEAVELEAKENNSGNQVISVYTSNGEENLLLRFIRSREIKIDDEFLKSNHQFPYVSGIDIFPLDYISRNEEEDNIRAELMNIVASVQKTYDKDEVEWGENTENVENIERLCAYKFDKTKPIKQQLCILMDQLSGLFEEKDADYITQIPIWNDGHTYRFPKEYYDEAVYVPFEDMMIPVPKYYDSILKLKYGDYMKLVKNGSSHGYPFFENQVKKLDEAIGYKYKEYKCCRADIPDIRKSDLQRGLEKKVVLFLPFKAKYWNTMEPFWKKECENKDCDVIVAAIPYIHCGFLGDILDIKSDIENFSDEINVIDAMTLNIKEIHPDVIYIQNSCDKYGKTLIVHPDYFSDKLHGYTEQLIYVPWFVTDDFDKSEERSYLNMESYCTMPGLVYADKTYVQSETMRNTYIEKLCEWSGEDTKEIWEGKLYVNPYGIEKREKEDIVIPVEWREFLLDKHRKIIVYGISAGAFEENGWNLVDKVRKSLEAFAQNKNDIAVIIYQDAYAEIFCRKLDESVWHQYEEVVQEYVDKGVAVLLTEDEEIMSQEDLVVLADAYYGDTGQLAHEFSSKKKPVMIQNINI